MLVLKLNLVDLNRPSQTWRIKVILLVPLSIYNPLVLASKRKTKSILSNEEPRVSLVASHPNLGIFSELLAMAYFNLVDLIVLLAALAQILTHLGRL